MNKSVLITGANSGFGYLMALKFAREGWKVYATTRDLEKDGAKSMNEIAGKEGLDVTWLVLDVTDGEAIKRAVREVPSLDVLVNNAGYGVLGPVETYTTEDFRKQLDANFFGVVEMTYQFLPLLKESRYGRIINISSIAGLIAAPAYALYSSSKHALEAYTEVLRYALSGRVKVSLIEPGGFDTKFSENAKGLGVDADDDSWFGRVKRFRNSSFLSSSNSFIKRARNPQIVADAVFKVANQRNPRLRNIIGVGTPLTAFFRRILPGPVWEWIVLFAVKRADKGR